MKVRAGLDVVAVDEIERAVADGTMLESWRPAELATAQDRPERLAGQWAAKEAVMKVLQMGIGTLSPEDIEIVNVDGCAPQVRLHGPAAAAGERARIVDLSLSITHERGLAAAMVVALTEEE
jgi:holo-[acyl-carrier protein] synthase